MTDPERLSRNSSSPLASLLLRAGAEERPSTAALRRATKAATLAAATGAVAKAAGATAASSKVVAVSATSGVAGGASTAGGGAITLGVVAQWVGIGVLGGLFTVPLVRELLPEPAVRPAPLLPSVVLPTDAADRSERESVTRRSAPAVVPSSTPNEREPSMKLEQRRAPTAPPALALEASEALTPTPGALLAAEVRFVDRGRAAFQRGALADTLTLLAPYEDRFPRQQLLTEVLFLRMEAESRLGNTERARALARRIVARGVAGPQAARAREVLER
jgi:hypothetical protein